MAAALIQDKEDNFLSCCVCFGQLKDPIGLPCLHAFCYQCLDKCLNSSSSDKTKVICPTCKTSFPKPKEGIQRIPGHFLVKNLKETVDSEKKVDDINCILCEKNADNHCIDCKKSLCKPCLKNHDIFTKDHKVVGIEEYQSGHFTDEGRFCQVHGEQVRYYCDTEQKAVCYDCVGLKICSYDHHRISLKEAVEKHRSLLQDEAEKCAEAKVKFQEAVDRTKAVQNDLKQCERQAMDDLESFETDYIQKVKQAFKEKKDNIRSLRIKRDIDLDGKLKALEFELSQIESVCNQVSHVSEYPTIIQKYPTLSTTLAILNQSQPQTVDTELGYLKFEPVKTHLPLFGHVLQHKMWTLRKTVDVEGLTGLEAIAIDENGDLVVGSWEKGIKVYTPQGLLKSTVYDNKGVVDVAISPDNRCVFKQRDIKSIHCNDMQGNRLFTTPILDVNNEPSNANSVAVDSRGRIIAGQVAKTISIHHAEGSLISKFATESRPYRLAITSNEEIVTSFIDLKLQHGRSVVLMDYSGGNIRVIQPLAEVKVWRPTHVCCRQGEIFVVNNSKGDPTGVYRFTSEGDYLGCVTTSVKNPTGIAVSVDGMELYVAERDDCSIKIFGRV